MEEVGLRVLEHSYMQVPALLAQLKDEDPGVACQAIVSGTKFFYSTLQELAQQFHRHDKVERWVEETWMQMIEFKDAVFSLVFEAAAVRTRLLALKFLETCILLFTPDAVNTNRLTSGGKEHRFNISWLANDHPVLDLAKLASEANRLFTSLLDMLRSSSSIPGPLTITIVNCLASIARKRTEHYGHILSALLDFHSKSETRSGHAASLQYSVRSALLGFLRCTHPVFIESRDRLVQELRSMNAGDAVDQVLRQVDKLMRNNERSSREARMVKEEQSSTQLPLSGDPIKRKLLPVDNEERDNDVEMPSKRLRYTSNGRSPDLVQIHGSADDNPVINGVPSEAPMVDNDVNPVEQMITVIAALLAEGERAAESLELLISQIHPDLLADIVITNMKHLPKTAPLPKQGALSSNAQNISAVSAAQITDSTSLPVLPPLSAQQGSIPAAVTFSTPPPDYSGSATLQVDSRRDPRRDPRRLDPRRVAVPSEAPLLPLAEEATHVSSILEGPAFVNRTTSLTSAPITEHISSHFVPDAEVDVKSSTLLVPENEVMPKEEEADESREILPSSDVNVLVNRALSPDHAVNESPITLTSFKIEPTDAACTSYIQESDEDSPPVSNTSACEETCEDLPEVPSYVYLTEKQRQTIKKLAVEQIVKSYKQLKDQGKEALTEQTNVVSQPEQAADVAAAEPKPSDEREADDSAVKTSEAGEIQADCTKGENDGTNDNEKPNASGNGGAALSSFQQLSNSQNAFTGLMGTGFSTSTFSFGSLQKDGSPSQASLPTFSFGAPTNGSTPLFGSVMTGTSIGTKTESSTFRSMPEVPTETGEENEETVFNADSALFEFIDGGWKERGKGEVKLNVLKGETQKARLVMRAKGNLRLILNASLFPDMKLTKMDKKGITFACVNIATEGKDGLSTFALKFKDGSIMEEFSSAVSAHKDKPATTELKTPENSPKASDD